VHHCTFALVLATPSFCPFTRNTPPGSTLGALVRAPTYKQALNQVSPRGAKDAQYRSWSGRRRTCLRLGIWLPCDAVSTLHVNIPTIHRAHKCAWFEDAFMRPWIVVSVVVSHATVVTAPYAAIYASASDVRGVFLRVCLLNAMTSATLVREKLSSGEFERP
jgi:hypothetical protein